MIEQGRHLASFAHRLRLRMRVAISHPTFKLGNVNDLAGARFIMLGNLSGFQKKDSALRIR
jgi:hypothetical protein